MTPVSHDERSAGARVLELLHAADLETLRERSKMLSVQACADLLIPVIAALASDDESGTAQRDLQPALATALYQSLVRERLPGPMDAVIAQVVAGEHKKPRELDKSIPRALELVIMRATRKRPEDRFPSVRHLGAALLPFASKQVRQSHGGAFPKPGANIEAMLERRLERGEDFKLLAAALAIALPFVVATRQSDETPPPVAAQAVVPPASAPAATREPAAVTTIAPAPKAEAERPVEARADASSSGAPSTYVIDVAVEPSTAWIMLDDRAAGRGRVRRELVRDGKTHTLHAGAPGYRVQALRFTDAPPPGSVVLAKRAP